ncbi:MAG: response regulator transcription factor [Cyanobacteria bacterium J06560_2]
MSSSASSSVPRFLIVDDHEAILQGTLQALSKAYPEGVFETANTAQQARSQLEIARPNLFVTDLQIPNEAKDSAQVDTGIDLLRYVMKTYPGLNILVQSSHARSLIRLKPSIDIHQAGFTIVEKSLPLAEMIEKADWALRGILYTPVEMRSGLEVRPEWIQLLQLAFTQGLQDKAIAEQMNIAERTVRHYWTRVQDALKVYPQAGTNTRIQTEIRARAEGLID